MILLFYSNELILFVGFVDIAVINICCVHLENIISTFTQVLTMPTAGDFKTCCTRELFVINLL